MERLPETNRRIAQRFALIFATICLGLIAVSSIEAGQDDARKKLERRIMREMPHSVYPRREPIEQFISALASPDAHEIRKDVRRTIYRDLHKTLNKIKADYISERVAELSEADDQSAFRSSKTAESESNSIVLSDRLQRLMDEQDQAVEHFVDAAAERMPDAVSADAFRLLMRRLVRREILSRMRQLSGRALMFDLQFLVTEALGDVENGSQTAVMLHEYEDKVDELGKRWREEVARLRYQEAVVHNGRDRAFWMTKEPAASAMGKMRRELRVINETFERRVLDSLDADDRERMTSAVHELEAPFLFEKSPLDDLAGRLAESGGLDSATKMHVEKIREEYQSRQRRLHEAVFAGFRSNQIRSDKWSRKLNVKRNSVFRKWEIWNAFLMKQLGMGAQTRRRQLVIEGIAAIRDALTREQFDALSAGDKHFVAVAEAVGQ